MRVNERDAKLLPARPVGDLDKVGWLQLGRNAVTVRVRIGGRQGPVGDDPGVFGAAAARKHNGARLPLVYERCSREAVVFGLGKTKSSHLSCRSRSFTEFIQDERLSRFGFQGWARCQENHSPLAAASGIGLLTFALAGMRSPASRRSVSAQKQSSAAYG